LFEKKKKNTKEKKRKKRFFYLEPSVVSSSGRKKKEGRTFDCSLSGCVAAQPKGGGLNGEIKGAVLLFF